MEETAKPDARDSAPERPPATSTPEVFGMPSSRATPMARWQRLHRLSGAFAWGAFLIGHVFVQASAASGAKTYSAIAGAIARGRFAPLLELVLAIPIGFHVVSGLFLLFRGEKIPDREIDRYGDRRLWVVQRSSSIFVLAFLLLHLWELRLQRLAFGLPADALYTILSAHLSSTSGGIPWIALLYLVGMGFVMLHFANGLHAASATWAATADAPRRRRIVSIALPVVLFAVGTLTVIAVATGTRLLPGSDAVSAPCGSAVPPAPPTSDRRP